MKMLQSAFFCFLLIFCCNVLPVYCQNSNEGRPQITDFQNLGAARDNGQTVYRSTQTTIPPTPRPEDVECYVTVPEVRRIGGMCVRYGPIVWVCQAGIRSQMNPVCQARGQRDQSQQRSRQGRRRRNRNRRSTEQ